MSRENEIVSLLRSINESLGESGPSPLDSDIAQGKAAIAEAITGKGIETATDATFMDMADNINSIVQEDIQIDGGEMYSKQLFGVPNNSITPGYWNLYDIMAQLLSDGRLVNYGGILLAEYYKGYASLALSGADAYVTSDGDYLTSGENHVWRDATDERGNRWVAYLYADGDAAIFDILDTNTCPRTIHIGRHIAKIRVFVDGRLSDIVTSLGTLGTFESTQKKIQNWGQTVTLRCGEIVSQDSTQGGAIYNNSIVEKLYVECDILHGNCILSNCDKLTTAILKANKIETTNNVAILGYVGGLQELIIDCEDINVVLLAYAVRSSTTLKHISFLNCEFLKGYYGDRCLYGYTDIKSLYFSYKDGEGGNDKTRTITYYCDANNGSTSIEDIELKAGWNKPVVFDSCVSLTEENMYTHILQRLKQDEADCGDGVTITLGATNLAKLTSTESIQLLDDLTNIYGYTFA